MPVTVKVPPDDDGSVKVQEIVDNLATDLAGLVEYGVIGPGGMTPAEVAAKCGKIDPATPGDGIDTGHDTRTAEEKRAAEEG